MNEYLQVKREEFDEIKKQSKLYISQSNLPQYMIDVLNRNIDYLALEAYTHLRRHLKAEEQLTAIRKLTNN